MSKVEDTLEKVEAPILIIQGDNDPTVDAKSAQIIYDKISSKDKKLLYLPRTRHSMLADEGHEEVFESVYRFIVENINKDKK